MFVTFFLLDQARERREEGEREAAGTGSNGVTGKVCYCQALIFKKFKDFFKVVIPFLCQQ